MVILDGGRVRNNTNKICTCPSGQSRNGSSCAGPTCAGTVDCAGTCDGTATDYNGTAAGCGTASYSCTGNAPANAVLCQDDAVGLTADTARTLVSACSAIKCEYTCAAGYNYNGGICQATNASRKCTINGTRSPNNASCPTTNYKNVDY